MRALRQVFARAADVADPILVALLAGTALIEVLVTDAPLLDAVLVCTVVLPLLARRRAPLLVLALVIAAGYAGWATGPTESGALQGWIALNLALYSVAAHCSLRRALVGAGLMACFVLLFEIPRLVEGGRLDDVIGEWLSLGGVWLLGRWVRQRRRRTHDLERQAADLEADRDALAREAVAEERARIAREMHDSVAHSVSVMVLQAGAAEQVMASSPERARASLVTIQDTGREAIVELRRMLGLLRDPSEGASLAPQPGVDRLDTLMEQVRAAGLPVALTVEGEPRRLPPGVDRSAYRIVQEGLTNTLKHAGPAHASVTLRYADRALELEVLDDGHGTGGPNGGGGFGLVGMRERAALYGGELDAGARPGGGYALRARLPLEREPS
jgi:signal transduction histidine kinase